MNSTSQIAKFMGPTWGPPGSCRPQMGPMLAPWTLLSRSTSHELCTQCWFALLCCGYIIVCTKFMWLNHPCSTGLLHWQPGSAFIKPDQRNPWIKDQIKITLLPTISHLLLPNFVSCGRACPSHMTQNLVTVGAKLWTADRFIVDPWSMDYADPVW